MLLNRSRRVNNDSFARLDAEVHDNSSRRRLKEAGISASNRVVED
jgi:hypothetical protein